MFRLLVSRSLIPVRNGQQQRFRTLIQISNNTPPKEAPSFIPALIRDQVAIKDSVKRIEMQTPSNVVKDLLMPSVNHLNQAQIIEKILPTTKTNEENFKICGYFRFGFQKPKFSMHLIRIKRRKIKKHFLRKWRKKYLSVILNRSKNREIRKEKNFRAELLAEIRKAENFNAEKYVEGVIKTIERAPKEDGKPLDRLFDLIRKHKFETHQVRPRFDDPVPTDFDKIK